MSRSFVSFRLLVRERCQWSKSITPGGSSVISGEKGARGIFGLAPLRGSSRVWGAVIDPLQKIRCCGTPYVYCRRRRSRREGNRRSSVGRSHASKEGR